MAYPCTLTTSCMCSFGAAPSTISVTGQTVSLAGGKPLATITDYPIVPFGMCSSMANPAVAAATAAKLGVFTPAPCTPVYTGTWIPGAATVLVGGKPCLNNQCTLMCAYGGVIKITAPNVVNVQVP